MESRRLLFNPPLSQRRKSSKRKKIKVCILPNGSVLGEPGTKWNSRVGDLIRTYIPINYKEWRHVPQHFKDDVWHVLMKEKEPEKEFKRVDSWFMGHEREDGSVLKSAKQKYDQLKEVCKKRQSTSTDGERSSSSMYDLGNDELTEVFVKDNNGGVRAVGSHISKKQLIHLGIADAHAEQKNKAKEDVSNVVFRLDGVENTMKDMFKILSNMSKGNFTVSVMTTPISDVDSYSAPPLDKIFTTMGASQHSHPIHPPMDKSQVILCGKFGKHLAMGYVEINSTREMCHDKKIGRGEKIVYVEEVFVPDAIIWDSSQTLVEYVEGG